MRIDPAEHDKAALYGLLTSVVTPRPIAWVSTVDEAGRANLAPFSYFTAVSSKPPCLLFCPGHHPDGRPKDTLANVRATGEFVVHVVTEALADAMNLTAATVAAGIDEIDLADLTPLASERVRPPRIAESPVALECRVVHTHDVSTEPGGGSIVVGEVLLAHVDDRLLADAAGLRVDPALLRTVGRLGGRAYARTRDVFELERPKADEALARRAARR